MNTEITKRINDMLNEYTAFYSKFLEFEKGKLDDVENNRLEKLDNLVKQEEVFLLKSKGMEQARIKFQAENGLADKKLREIIEEITDDDQRNSLMDMFKDLNSIVNELQHTNEKCNIAIKVRLQKIEQAIEKCNAQNKQKTQKVYDDAANSHTDGKSFFSSKA